MGLILENLPTGMENISLGEGCLTLVKMASAVPFIMSLEMLGLAARPQLKLMSPFPRCVHTCTGTSASWSLHTARPSRSVYQHQVEFDGNKKTSVRALLRASLVAQLVKNPPAMQETPVQFLGWEDPLETG